MFNPVGKMLQRVITELYLIRDPANESGFEPGEGSALAKALLDGWVITDLSTAIMGQCHCATFVLEKEVMY